MSTTSAPFAADRLGRVLLALAIATALVLALVDVGAPWEDGLRGENAAIYEDVFVRNHLRYGLGVTHGAPAYVYETDGHPVCTWHWHHPGTYPLYLTAVAAVLGQSEVVLRLAHLLLFLPGVAALWWLLARLFGERFAGLGALFFVASPMIGYFGPMVVHDGAVLSAGLAAAASFVAACQRPSAWATARTLVLYFVATQLDFLGHFWGPALFVLAFVVDDRRRALRLVAAAFVVSLVSLLLVACHYATIHASPFHGSPFTYLQWMLETGRQSGARAPTSTELTRAAHEVLFDYGAWPVWAACAAGALALGTPAAGALPRRRTALAGLALLLPGAASCAVSLRHAVDHAFWSMPTTAGAAVFAAVTPFLSLAAAARGSGRRWLAGIVALFAMAPLVHGPAKTVALVVRFRPVNGSFAALAAEAAPHVNGAALAMTNRSVPMRPFLPGLLFLGPVRTGADLEQWLAYGRSQSITADLAFVLDLAEADPSLVERLDRLAQPVRTEHTAVYRFRP